MVIVLFMVCRTKKKKKKVILMIFTICFFFSGCINRSGVSQVTKPFQHSRMHRLGPCWSPRPHGKSHLTSPYCIAILSGGF